MAACATSSGLKGGEAEVVACAKHPSVYDPILLEAYTHSKTVQYYPYSTLNGKELPQGLSAKQLKAALCKAGAQAAC